MFSQKILSLLLDVAIGTLTETLLTLMTHYPLASKNLIKRDFFIFGGDINIDLLKSNLSQTQNYLDTMLSHNFIPNITIPTRFSTKSMTLIDHIMT